MGRQNKVEWNKVFRMSVIEDQSHKQISSWRFSRLGILVVLISVVVIFSLTVYCLIAFTPLKTTIPGYPDAHFKREAIANAIKIDSLESAMMRWNIYAENLSRVLAGEESLNLDSIMSTNRNSYLKDLSEKEIARQDSLLRATVNKEEQFGVSGKPERKLPIEGLQFFTPLKGTISQPFDKTLHPGIDINAPSGSVVCAVLDGTVIFTDWSDEYGYTIQIQHQDDLVSIYKHNQKLLKRTGDKVSAGSSIALLGGSGTLSMSNDEHLHFELWYKGDAVDPQKYIKF